MAWNSDLYHRYREARSAPVDDLLALVPGLPYRDVVDLGCGTGEPTRRLAEHFPDARVLGLDSSAEMLAKADASGQPNLRFRQGDLLELTGEYDLIFSNAALQWLPDHPALLARLWERLRPGGVLAVQVPANHDHDSHRLLTGTAEAFAAELGGFTRFGTAHGASPVLTPAAYAEVLDALGAAEVTALSKVYPVVLPGAEGVLDWTRGTALVPYLSRLGRADAARFTAAYLARLRERWPGERVYYAFTRVLFTARRG
ncbi:methyltransferase domain-containing protein [Deinococcus sp. MIMF12]|uniref:Methyltransferase domain-containing protein n=1 Tax=Deinococcus rhizophilus TaxID=3049544 RepID=A0ABT7JMA1_9DEIO|nr:methyltransferase domain-containing protein [Deinococcus rhizophilus]MDL2345068.1 methyltransferase domain-containing protein [Deinococcus rhizophilus]